jgi:hypothetical protein
MQLSSTVLQQLTTLTHLQLSLQAHTQSSEMLAAAADPPWQHLSCLQQLVHLALFCRVTCRSAFPGFNRLTALTALELVGGSLAPVALRSCTQLRSLSMAFCNIVSGVAGGAAGGSVLLSELGHLQQLQQLSLHVLACAWPPLGAAYSTITASSKLERLQLKGCADLYIALRYMCPEGRSLPVLRNFALSPFRFSRFVAPAVPLLVEPALSAADVSRLVRCCPGIVNASLIVSHGLQLGQLGQLSSLTRLHIFRAGVLDHLSSLSAVTGLRDLLATDTHYLQQSQLFALTALRQLTGLQFDCDSAGPSEADQPPEFVQQVRVKQR